MPNEITPEQFFIVEKELLRLRKRQAATEVQIKQIEEQRQELARLRNAAIMSDLASGITLTAIAAKWQLSIATIARIRDRNAD